MCNVLTYFLLFMLKKLLNKRRNVAHQKIINRIANQLARIICKTTLIDLHALQIIWLGKSANHLA